MLSIIDDSLILAKPIPNGFTYTLASRLGQMLNMAEQDFGPRDKTFTILGIEFRDGVPQSWFPCNCGHVVIQLSREAMQDPNRAFFQLAHECIHLLDPCPGGTNKLEEGVATHFALCFMKNMGVSYTTGDERYDKACCLVKQLLGKNPQVIKDLRKKFGPLRNITKEQIMGACPTLYPGVAQELTAPFCAKEMSEQ